METDQNIYYDIPYTQHTKLPHTEHKPYEKQNSNRDNEDIPQQSVPKPLSKILFLAYILEDETPNKAANQKPESKQLSKEQKKRIFMQSAGKVKVDANAVNELRERSII